MKKSYFIFLLAALLLANVLTRVPDSFGRRTGSFEHLGLIVDVRHEIMRNYVTEPEPEELAESAVRGMIDSLDDPFTSYLTQEDLESFDKQVRGSFSGIGAEVTVDPELDRLKIVTPLEDSPAWKSGVMAGDIVLTIDGTSTKGMDIHDAVDRLTGTRGTDVTIRVRHESGEKETITITRDKIEIQTVKGFRRGADHEWRHMLDKRDKIGYLRLTQFNDRTAREVRSVLNHLQQRGLEGLILDVRFNPGGVLEAALDVSDHFLPKGKTIVSVKGRAVEEQVYTSSGETMLPEVPIVVLGNDASASASEITAGALADNGRAKFIGTRTYGKGSVQQVRMLESGQGALKITNAHYYLPSGRNIHRQEGDDVWGVDPEAGFYVPMAPEETQKMLEVRREGEIIRPDESTKGAGRVTPAWIRQKLEDKQLAAALTAVEGRIETGHWPKVGRENVDRLVKLGEIKKLKREKQLLQERIAEIDNEIESTRSETAATQPADQAAAD